jgi:dolichol-phosphate mannosyltransferase
LLVAVPVYNESRYVERVLGQIRGIHPDLLVVDDGSSDGTSQILQRMAAAGQIEWIRHPVNRGYGQSIIDAFKYAAAREYDWVITMDCDEQHEPQMIPAFAREIQSDRWDIISGSRYLERRPDDDRPPGDRRRINAAITQKLNATLGLELTDAFCGFKAHRVSAMRRLSLDEPGYAFPLQFWPQAAKAGLRITEIPVRLIYNDPGRNFGGILDDADRRLRHYLSVLAAEMNRPAPPPVDEASSEACELATGCCCKHD